MHLCPWLHELEPGHEQALNFKRIASAARLHNFQLDGRGNFSHNVFFHYQECFTGFHDHKPTHPEAFAIFSVETQIFTVVKSA
jgi:hypothetical protein